MVDKGQGDSLQGTSSRPLCANGCGFFGSTSTMNMCSKCFREHAKATHSPTPSPTPAPATPVPASPSTPVPTSTTTTDPAPPSPSIIPVPPSPPTTLHAPPPRKVQKNTSRCFSCRKKVGLTGFECRCGYVYCATHRYSDQHQCDFDYQLEGREQLVKNNPVVVAAKLDKI